MTTNQTIKEMSILFNWSEGTISNYQSAIKGYTKFHKTNLDELIREAEEDEEKNIKLNKRRLKTRLTSYQLYLKEQGLQNTTINQKFTLIKSIYHYHDINVPQLPRLKKEHHETYKNVVKPEEIKKAINNTTTKMRAIITFIASSGLRVSDTISLTVNDLLIATKEYHKAHTPRELIDQLDGQKNVIPLWEITSIKTGIQHITFNSPEATLYIIQLLKERLFKEELSLDSRIFDLKNNSVSTNFNRLNDRLGFGWNVTRRHFHAHGLRTFFSTTLTVNGLDYLSTEFMMGHRLPPVQSSYYYANPEKLKNKYARYVDKLCFNMSVDYISLSDRDKRELEALRAENKKTRERLRQLEELVDIINHSI